MIFTFIVDFRGGTYCTQVFAENITESMLAWTEKLKIEKGEIKYLGDNVIRELQIASKDIDNQPIPLNNLTNVWYNQFTTKQGKFSINIVQTQTDIKI